LKFIEDNEIRVLNVAGPRASGWAGGYRFAADVIGGVIGQLARGLPQGEVHGGERAG
jgi:hypothetical protein